MEVVPNKKKQTIDRKVILILSAIGLVIIFGVIVTLFFIFSSGTDVTQVVKTNKYLDTVFLTKFNSQPFKYTLSSSITNNSLIGTSSLPMYKYELKDTINLKKVLVDKYKLDTSKEVIDYSIDNNTKLLIDSNGIQINFNVVKQSDVFGFGTPDNNSKKGLEYLKTFGVTLDSSNFTTKESYNKTGAGEYIVSDKTNGEIQTLSLFPKVKDFSYIFNSGTGIISMSFNKANDLLSISVNASSISNYNITSTNSYLDYLNLSTDVLNESFINTNGIYLPNYPTDKTLLLTNIEYVYLPSKDNYLIPFVILSDKSSLNEVLLPIVSPSRIIYGY
ncbi:MAG: hypothetical protein WCO33_00380 [bacterium]